MSSTHEITEQYTSQLYDVIKREVIDDNYHEQDGGKKPVIDEYTSDDDTVRSSTKRNPIESPVPEAKKEVKAEEWWNCDQYKQESVPANTSSKGPVELSDHKTSLHQIREAEGTKSLTRSVEISNTSMDGDLNSVIQVYELYKLYTLLKLYRRYKSRRKCWVHQINRQRDSLGAYACLMPQLKDDQQKFYNYCRMSIQLFKSLLTEIRDDISKPDTNFRKSIPPELKLMLSLRFLVTGESFQSLHYQFRVGNKTARQALYDVCDAIWKRLGPLQMPQPTSESFIEVSQRFLELWQFPNCIGAIDGKHIKLKCPNLSGSQFFNYNSIVLQAVADADGLFQFIDVGSYDRHCDARVFKYSSFGRALTEAKLPLPEDAPVFGSEPLPFVFLGDEAYPLLRHLMRPFSRRDLNDTRRIYNDRHSRARRVVECAFGMLTSKWGALQTTLQMTPEHAQLITLACCVLHNYVRRSEGKDFASDLQFTEGETLQPIDPRPHVGRPNQEALSVRMAFASLMEKNLISLKQAQSAHVE